MAVKLADEKFIDNELILITRYGQNEETMTTFHRCNVIDFIDVNM